VSHLFHLRLRPAPASRALGRPGERHRALDEEVARDDVAGPSGRAAGVEGEWIGLDGAGERAEGVRKGWAIDVGQSARGDWSKELARDDTRAPHPEPPGPNEARQWQGAGVVPVTAQAGDGRDRPTADDRAEEVVDAIRGDRRIGMHAVAEVDGCRVRAAGSARRGVGGHRRPQRPKHQQGASEEEDGGLAQSSHGLHYVRAGRSCHSSGDQDVLNRRGIPETRFVGDELRPKLPVIIRTASRITGDTVGDRLRGA